MTMPLPAATARIARQLHDAEKTADAALLASSELMTSLILARSNPAVIVHTGQQALMRLVRAQQSIIDGTNDLFRVHAEVSSIGKELNLLDEEGSTPLKAFLEAEADAREQAA